MKMKGVSITYPEDAAADLALLRPDWWMNWRLTPDGAPDAPGHVPMLWYSQIPVGECQPIYIVGNEHNAEPPYGLTLTPHEAAQKLIGVERACPNSLLVAGNAAMDDWGHGGGGIAWTGGLLAEYRRIAGRNWRNPVGIHCYASSVAWGWRKLSLFRLVMRYRFDIRDIWITEGALIGNNSVEAGRYMDILGRMSTHWNWTPARWPRPYQPWVLAEVPELVGQDGTLTSIGQMFVRK